MNKKEVIETLYQSAKLFDKNLKSRNLLIIYGQPNSPKFMETHATDDNFIHLAGINLTNKETTPTMFYQNILDKKVSENDFSFKSDGTSQLKLDVLPYIMELNRYAKMMGVYNNRRPKLKTDKLVGNITASLGFIQTGKYFTPNTVLKGDIRDDIEKSERVLAILSKTVKEHSYSRIETVAKKVYIEEILNKLSKSVSIATELLSTKKAENSLDEIVDDKKKNISSEKTEETKSTADTKQPTPTHKKDCLFCLADLKSKEFAPRSQKKENEKTQTKKNNLDL